MLRKDFINRKISLIQEDLVKLSELKKYSLKEIQQDFYKSATVERLLERVISRAIDINQHLISELLPEDEPPRSYKETFFKLVKLKVYPEDFAAQIAKSIGTRNILVHDYNNVDYALIYSSVNDCIKDYTKYIDFVLAFLNQL